VEIYDSARGKNLPYFKVENAWDSQKSLDVFSDE